MLNFQGDIDKRVCIFTCHASLTVAPFMAHKDEKDEICGVHQNKGFQSFKIMVNWLYNHECENTRLKFRW